MEGNYCEARAKKRKTAGDTAIKGLIIFGIAVSLIAAFLFGQTLILLVGVALGIVAYFVFPRLNVEYEYVFCDGQLDFDKIMNGDRRKHIARIDMEQVVVCAPVKSQSLLGYDREGVRKIDFSSRETNARIWGLVTTAGEQSTMYLFEPSEDMVRRMKQKGPRKVVEY
ncbi:MAG: DUF6106 family protein [Lachnospiraceae bacterium]|nr:DUF6106 family protein [Lachnospiraceae bacterium]